MKKVWIIVGCVIVIVVGYSLMMPEGVPVQCAKATVKRISAYVEEDAVTALPRTYSVTMPLDGRIMPIKLSTGTKVKAGQVVARMDVADLQTQVEASRCRVRMADAAIALSKFEAIEQTALKESAGWIKCMADTVAAALKKSEASKAQKKFADWDMESASEMAKGNAISKKELYKIRANAAEATVEYEADVLEYRAIETIRTIFKLAPVYINEFLNWKKLDRNILIARREEAQAGLTKAQRDMKRSVMSSPIDGVVLKRYHQNETVLPAGTKLLDVGNPADIEVHSNILSQDAVNIKPDDLVEIYGGSLGSKTIIGTVKKVDPRAFTKVSSLGVDEQRVRVTVSFKEDELAKLKSAGHTLGVGFRLYVRIHTADVAKAVVIPRTALFRGNKGDWNVFKIVGGDCKLTPVEIGLKNDLAVQVLKGINPGDQLIVAPPTSLSDGDKVKLDE